MIVDPNRLFDGLQTCEAGMDGGNSPLIIGQNQAAQLVNVTTRGGFLKTRPPFSGMFLTYANALTQTHFNEGVMQGSEWYESDDPNAQGLIVCRGGRQFMVKFLNNATVVHEITGKIAVTVFVGFTVPALGGNVTVFFSETTEMTVGDGIKIDSGLYTVVSIDTEAGSADLSYTGSAANATVPAGTAVLHQDNSTLYFEDVNPGNEYAFPFQAENYMIILQGSQLPLIYDGSIIRRSMGDTSDPPELPPAFVGAYVNGRVWLGLPNRRNYIGCDLVGSSSGTQEFSFIDAVLKSSQNTFINEGGAFSVPGKAGKIVSIAATISLDTSLGQGPVSVFTEKAVFTNSAPPDAATWKDLTYPIQTVAAVEYGAVAPRSTVNVNADVWYRSRDGIRSFIIARRDFNAGWGNTPMSHEVSPIIEGDQENILFWCSSALFDNRLLTTCAPKLTPEGIVFQAMVVMNFDEISGMRGKTNPAWEGAWTGLDVFQVVKFQLDNVERCMMLVRSPTGETEIWELLTEGVHDRFLTSPGGTLTITQTPISCLADLRDMTFAQPKEPKLLQTLEWFYDEIFGTVVWNISFRPDSYPAFIPWQSVSVCNNTSACDQVCGTPTTLQPGYRPYQRTGLAPETCLANGRPANLGYHFQPRIQWTGNARITWVQLEAMMHMTETMPEPCETTACQSLSACDAAASMLGYSSRG